MIFPRAAAIRSLALFALIPGLAVAAPLVAYPAITSRYGADGFTAIAIGQSVGLTAAVLLELGWSVIGPQAVAGGRDLDEMHRLSISTKTLAGALVIPIACVGALFIPSSDPAATSLTALATALAGFSPIWLLTGLNRPGVVLVADALPRLVLTVGCALLIWRGAPLAVFAAPGLIVGIGSVIASSRIVGFDAVPTRSDFRDAPRLLRQQAPLTTGRSVTVVYTTLATTLVATINPGAAAVYAATDRLMRMGLAILAAIPARLQSWVGSASNELSVGRSNKSLLINTALGVVAALTFACVAPFASSVLFSNTIQLPFITALFGAFVVLLVCISRGLGLSLVAEERPNFIALASTLAALSAMIAMIALVPEWGANGALIAVASAELVGVAIQCFALHRGRRGNLKKILVAGEETSSNDRTLDA